MHVTNSYIHAKFERVLLDIYRDIHHFINVIYYSWVDDVKRHLFACFKNLNISETKQGIEKLKTLLSLISKCCSFTIKIGMTIFSLQWHFKDMTVTQTNRTRRSLLTISFRLTQTLHILKHTNSNLLLILEALYNKYKKPVLNNGLSASRELVVFS